MPARKRESSITRHSPLALGGITRQLKCRFSTKLVSPPAQGRRAREARSAIAWRCDTALRPDRRARALPSRALPSRSRPSSTAAGPALEYLRAPEEVKLPSPESAPRAPDRPEKRFPVPQPAHRVEFPVRELREGHGAAVRLGDGIASHGPAFRRILDTRLAEAVRHQRRGDLIKDQPVTDEVVGQRKFIVQAAGRIVRSGMPV